MEHDAPSRAIAPHSIPRSYALPIAVRAAAIATFALDTITQFEIPAGGSFQFTLPPYREVVS